MLDSRIYQRVNSLCWAVFCLWHYSRSATAAAVKPFRMTGDCASGLLAKLSWAIRIVAEPEDHFLSEVLMPVRVPLSRARPGDDVPRELSHRPFFH